MSEQNNTALIQRVYEAFATGDVQTILDHLTPDVVWRLDGPSIIPFAGVKTGPAQVLEFFVALGSTLDNPKLATTDYIAQGDKVVTVGRFSGRVKATGKSIDSAVTHVFTIRDGKISGFLDFVDTAQMADAYASSSTAVHA